MKKIIILIAILSISFSGQVLFSLDSTEPDGSGLLSSGFFNVIDTPNRNNDGVSVFYYDDTSKSMVIRLQTPNNTNFFYCFENENPKLYNQLLMFVIKMLDGYNCRRLASTSGNTDYDGESEYYYINIWYKTMTYNGSSKNIIRGFTFRCNL